MGTRTRRTATGVVVAVLALLLASCAALDGGGGGGGSDGPAAEPTSTTPEPTASGHAHHAAPVKQRPLRAGEKRMTLAMPAPYTPAAPNGTGTDDYRCFLLDPRLAEKVFLTGTSVLPGNPDVVHHVILFSVPPGQVEEARTLDDATPGEGWTCFGGSGLRNDLGLDRAPWLGAWAPGGTESMSAPGFGKPLAPGSRIVMQVHYNLRAGVAPDTSSTVLRYRPGTARVTPLETVLLPSPVEMPCRPRYADGPLCDREAAMADVIRRFGGAGNTNNLLYFLCGGQPKPSTTTSCDRQINRPTTIREVAGHMHLLGRSVTIEVNPGTPEARTILDIPVWDFDNQASRSIRPVRVDVGDVVRVTCTHAQWPRDLLPSFEGIPDRYVVWGEGTTDEMCLGILTVTRP